MFDTVLIANRGEIACRVIRTLRSLGIRSVAVYSDADRDACHVRLADVAVRLGPARAAESYLSIERIIDAARSQGADAIHPGYGFLSESADFARACEAAGIVFIGPGVEALEVMGDKITAKKAVAGRGVPTVPGIAEPGLDDETLARAALDIGFPVLIKPSAGGGGKGMHLVEQERDLLPALQTARREASSSFGDDTLFIERFVQTPRHIEVQVLADAHGTTVHLGERECSLQRRHQKVIEEAPSALLDAATRERIGRAAVETARSVGYRGAGTVEFIVSADAPDEFFFMEMNTRLQVEHPVTELVGVIDGRRGIDLVEQQLRIAAGERLDFAQEDVTLSGHAVEARIYAEEPQRGFLPTGGRILQLDEPAGDGIRVDSALIEGLTVTSDYDPMMAKLIAWGPDRATALERLDAALGRFVTLGVDSNVEFLRLLVDDPEVRAGRLDTELIERRLDGLRFREADDEVLAAAALVLHSLAYDRAGGAPWDTPSGWRLGEHAPSRYALAPHGQQHATDVLIAGAPGAAHVAVGEADPVEASVELDGEIARISTCGVTRPYRFAVDGDRVLLFQDGASWTLVQRQAVSNAADDEASNPELRSPMPGTVTVISADDDAEVAEGDPVLIVEAMKMEHVLRAPHAGTVSLRVAVGDQVTGDQVVAVVSVTEDGEDS
ncbi:ATP-binding protein [Humibacter sp.]|uniref:acetyl/propionyl/methylcrotonyl-CoA carboxylase subunit alpha n=1 Tax=Humibacter sp. TaxID=1940291 RepID=UPI003F7E5482